ncbi:MAG: sugar transferase [Bacteroidales bacterium]|nr:sugar transferase [Bacteroidales bacterium]
MNTISQPARRYLYELFKNICDVILSVFIIILLSPLLLLLAFMIRISGKGPVIYSQDRIGKNGKPFVIYKFRSMKYDAESGSPMLSCANEERVTRIGGFMRKYRIDEIPNFINVLKGEMSVVGPRPERKYYIDQIVLKNPRFAELLKIRPGITSWGQVKFGYASNVDEMLERLEYDLYYVNHRSLWFDIKIMLYTLRPILKGKGL